MTKDDIIRMAREAGMPMAWIGDSGVLNWADLLAFANRVAKHEREACAKVFDTPPAAPSEWPLIKNILAEYGLDAIAFVAEWKAAQRPWQGLTEEDWAKVAADMPDTFDQGVAWAQARLKERNNG